MVDLHDVVEIEECGQRRANQLLALGYRLIAVTGVSFEMNRRKVAPGTGETFIRHDYRYAIVREKGDAPFPERERREFETPPEAPREAPAP